MSAAGTFRAQPVCDALVELSTLVLPRGETRRRFRQEHQAELRHLALRHQLVYTVGVLLSMWTLRASVCSQGLAFAELALPRKPLRCRLGIHRWRDERSPGGDAYRRCVRCGKDDDGRYLERTRDVIGGGAPGAGSW